MTTDDALSVWLTKLLDWLLTCLKVREHVSWEEITSHIDRPWLEKMGFGPPAVEIRSLRGALISETPRTARPPTSLPAEPPSENRVKKESAQVQTLRIVLSKIGPELNGLTVQRRNERIREEARKLNLTVPSDRTIQRHIGKFI
jgi:hypothetical protein